MSNKINSDSDYRQIDVSISIHPFISSFVIYPSTWLSTYLYLAEWLTVACRFFPTPNSTGLAHPSACTIDHIPRLAGVVGSGADSAGGKQDFTSQWVFQWRAIYFRISWKNWSWVMPVCIWTSYEMHASWRALFHVWSWNCARFNDTLQESMPHSEVHGCYQQHATLWDDFHFMWYKSGSMLNCSTSEVVTC